jgi:thiaminase (transcriptional activator TenA)
MSAQSLWDAAASLITKTERHPFLVAMVDGSLDMNCFRYYVVQDALYLKDFAYCLRLLSKNDGVDATDAARLESFAKGAEEAEMSLHNSFFVEWQISTEGIEQMPNCLLYTSYMQRIVATRCHAEGLAVLLPCFWVYMHVGKCMLKLRETLGDSVKRPAPYDAWIDMYGGEEFEKEVKDYISMVDTAIHNVADDESTCMAMKTHFIMSCRLEYMFWDQAHSQLQWPSYLTIGSDS